MHYQIRLQDLLSLPAVADWQLGSATMGVVAAVDVVSRSGRSFASVLVSVETWASHVVARWGSVGRGAICLRIPTVSSICASPGLIRKYRCD